MLEGLRPLFALLSLEEILARDHDVAALLVQFNHGNFERLALHAIEVTNRAKVDLRSGQEGVRAENIYSEATLDAIDHNRLDRLLLVVGFVDLFPRVNALGLLVREGNVAFFRFALVAHYIDFVPWLELGVALMIEDFRERQHTF